MLRCHARVYAKENEVLNEVLMKYKFIIKVTASLTVTMTGITPKCAAGREIITLCTTAVCSVISYSFLPSSYKINAMQSV